jgi:hypothetical protein
MELVKVYYYRKKLLQAIGFEKASTAAIKVLMVEIEQEINSKISFNTLRRFFGLLESKKFNYKTWMTLTDFLRQKIGHTFERKNANITFWKSYHRLLLELTKRDEASIIGYLIEEKNTENFTILLSYLTNHAIANKNIKLLKSLYTHSSLFEGSSEFSTFLAELVMPFLMDLKNNDLEQFFPIINLYNFKNNIIYFHIAYSYFNGNYGLIINQMVANDEQEQLFLNTLKAYHIFLSGKVLKEIPKKSLIELKACYPTLAGRYIGYQLLLYPESTTSILEELIKPLAKHFTPHYFYLEIFSALLLNKDFNLLSQLIDSHYEALYEIDHWYAFTTLNMYQIAESAVYVKEGQLKRAYIVLDSIHIEQTSSDYFDYIYLFYSIVYYHILQFDDLVGKQKVLATYKKTAQRVGFYRFDEELLINFFK